MLAWFLDRPGAIKSLQLRKSPEPDPGAGHLLIRVHGGAVNPADLRVVAGSIGARFVHARRHPLIPGFDFSGTIEGVGSDVAEWNVGEEVFGFLPYDRSNDRGSFAELLSVAPHEIARKPATVSHAEAASAATAGTTALQAIRLGGNPRGGQRWLVHGASGGVGSFAVQFGQQAGVEVWGTCSGESMPHVGRLGAQRVLDYRETKLSDVRTRFDLVLDVAARSSFHECERLIKTGGTYVALLPSFRFVTGMLRSIMSPRSCRLVAVHQDPQDLGEIARRIDARRLKVPIDSSWSMSDVPSALQRLSEGHVRGKVAIVMSARPLGSI